MNQVDEVDVFNHALIAFVVRFERELVARWDGRRAFKLYRPRHLQGFACRTCHHLSYTSVQKHDARLDRLLKMPDQELMGLRIRTKT